MTEETYAKMEDKVREIAKKNKAEVAIIRAPTDPQEKKEWAKRMRNLQISMWISDGCKCAYCGYVYKNVDDFLKRNPRMGFVDKDDPNFFDKMFVCNSCFQVYKVKMNGGSGVNGAEQK